MPARCLVNDMGGHREPPLRDLFFRRNKMMKTHLYIFAGCIVLAICSVASTEPFAKGPYLGQIPPGSTPQVFAPGLICYTGQGQWESHGHFSADGNTFCFARNRRVFITENTDQGWIAPKRIKSIPYKIWSPCLSPDANSIYFMGRSSTRSRRNSYDPSTRASLRRCVRTSKGWSLPEEL